MMIWDRTFNTKLSSIKKTLSHKPESLRLIERQDKGLWKPLNFYSSKAKGREKLINHRTSLLS